MNQNPSYKNTVQFIIGLHQTPSENNFTSLLIIFPLNFAIPILIFFYAVILKYLSYKKMKKYAVLIHGKVQCLEIFLAKLQYSNPIFESKLF